MEHASHQFPRIILFLLYIRANGHSIGETQYVYEWSVIDYDWPTEEQRQEALNNGSYIPHNNIIAGVKVYKDDVFITVPRWLPGVPSTMNRVIEKNEEYILQPFPSWAMQERGDCTKFQFTQSMEIDPERGEMWIIDRGNLVGCGPKLIIIDVNTGDVRLIHEFPRDVLNRATNFVNDIAIDPRRQVAYMSDVGRGPLPRLHEGGIVVFDRESSTSNRIEHDSMKSEPGMGEIEINGVVYDYSGAPTDGIALSPDKTQLYWCPLGGVKLWQMPSSVARNQQDADLDDVIRGLGAKVSQTDGMVMGHKGLYFGALSLNSIYMWEYKADMENQSASLENVEMETQTKLVQDNEQMIWPDTFAMDGEGWLWCTPNMLPQAMARVNNGTDYPNIKFRVSKTWADDVSYLDPGTSPEPGSGSLLRVDHTLLLMVGIIMTTRYI